MPRTARDGGPTAPHGRERRQGCVRVARRAAVVRVVVGELESAAWAAARKPAGLERCRSVTVAVHQVRVRVGCGPGVSGACPALSAFSGGGRFVPGPCASAEVLRRLEGRRAAGSAVDQVEGEQTAGAGAAIGWAGA